MSSSAAESRGASDLPSPASCRLGGPGKRRFEEIFQTGKRASGRWSRVCGLPGEGLVGVATSRAAGSRPRRNLLKRRALAAIEPAPGLDIVIIMQSNSASADWQELKSEIGELVAEIRSRWEGE